MINGQSPIIIAVQDMRKVQVALLISFDFWIRIYSTKNQVYHGDTGITEVIFL